MINILLLFFVLLEKTITENSNTYQYIYLLLNRLIKIIDGIEKDYSGSMTQPIYEFLELIFSISSQYELSTDKYSEIDDDNKLLHEQINLLEQENVLLQNQINSINEQYELSSGEYGKLLCEKINLLKDTNIKLTKKYPI